MIAVSTLLLVLMMYIHAGMLLKNAFYLLEAQLIRGLSVFTVVGQHSLFCFIK